MHCGPPRCSAAPECAGAARRVQLSAHRSGAASPDAAWTWVLSSVHEAVCNSVQSVCGGVRGSGNMLAPVWHCQEPACVARAAHSRRPAATRCRAAGEGARPCAARRTAATPRTSGPPASATGTRSWTGVACLFCRGLYSPKHIERTGGPLAGASGMRLLERCPGTFSAEGLWSPRCKDACERGPMRCWLAHAASSL